MAENEDSLRSRLAVLNAELDRRVPLVDRLDRYYGGTHPLPQPVQDQRITKAYRALMALSPANWPKLIVDSVEERLEVQGVRFGDEQADSDVWDIWQDNALDSESTMLHQSALTDGRAYAIVWAGESADRPSITPEHASMCVVQYAPGSRRERVAALRRWTDGTRWFATLYLPDAIYKFRSTTQRNTPLAPRDIRQPTLTSLAGDDIEEPGWNGELPEQMVGTGAVWERREVKGERWPLPNPLRTVPVVEFAVNRTLRPDVFGTAQGEFEANTNHIDRINYKTFCGLVALTWSGFPLRALIGDPIRRDADDNPMAPFDVAQSSIVQIENPDGRLVQLQEARVDNYSPEMDIKHLAALTKTPAHYLLADSVNPASADAIRAGEAGLISKIRRHHRTLGEAWEDVVRLALRVKQLDDPRAQEADAQIIWKDPESRSMAERADAAVKLKDILPWQANAQYVLAASPLEIERWEAQKMTDVLSTILTAPEPAAPTNGNGGPPAPPAAPVAANNGP